MYYSKSTNFTGPELVQKESLGRRRRRSEEKPPHHSRIPHRHGERSQDFPGSEYPSQAGRIDPEEEQHDCVAEKDRGVQVEEAAEEQAVLRNQEAGFFGSGFLCEEEALYPGC